MNFNYQEVVFILEVISWRHIGALRPQHTLSNPWESMTIPHWDIVFGWARKRWFLLGHPHFHFRYAKSALLYRNRTNPSSEIEIYNTDYWRKFKLLSKSWRAWSDRLRTFLLIYFQRFHIFARSSDKFQQKCRCHMTWKWTALSALGDITHSSFWDSEII